jgi:hypothetical protein
MKICRKNRQNEYFSGKKADVKMNYSELSYIIRKNIVKTAKFDCEQEYHHFLKTKLFFIFKK